MTTPHPWVAWATVDPVDVRPNPAYSHAVTVTAGSQLLFFSGQVPEDTDGNVAESFEDQARQAWHNVERTLIAGGFTLDDICKLTMFIRNRDFRPAVRVVRNEVMGDRRPALTVIVAEHLDERWLIEIEGIAAKAAKAANS
jgi:2-iminobutanoate/2-iminopropanoate deaminase